MANRPANIHDAFFKNVLSDPETAGTFLREHLPPDVATLLSDDPPQPLPGSFVDEKLGQHQSDVLFHLRLKEGSEALAYLLVEHKSSPDPLARLQLLRYITRILADWHRNNKRLPLPPVIPLLAYHGPRGWRLSTEFSDLFGPVPDPLRPYLLSFRHVLVDLARIEDGDLSRHIRLRAFLKVLKYIQRRDLPARIDIVLAEIPHLNMMDVALILNYIDEGPVTVGSDLIEAALNRLLPGRTEEIMGHLTQPYYEKGEAKGREEGLVKGLQQGLVKGLQQGRVEGRQEGRVEGRQEGRQEGRVEGLVRLLEKRFGPLPPHLQERISAADGMTIEIWFDRAIEAPDLPSVFETST